MKHVYLAGPFFNETEVKNIEKAESVLEGRGFDLFSPMRHEVRTEPGTVDWARDIFEMDRTEIDRADLVVALDLDVPGALRVHSKCDLACGEGLNVSAVTGEGLDALKAEIAARLAARAASSDEPQAEASARRGELLGAAKEALARAAEGLPDLVLAANGARAAAESLGRLAGKVYADDLLDALFSRFCIGK